jgi:predicted transcriptional regulator YdeE
MMAKNKKLTGGRNRMTKNIDRREFCINGFKITIREKSAFEVIGFSKFVRLDGNSIGRFLDEISKTGKLNKLEKTLNIPQQIWVCLSGNEGNSDADCRCTVCVEKTNHHDLSQFKGNELFTLQIPESEWADFELDKDQSPTELHKIGVYNMIGDIGCKFNQKVGLHFDNEYEWESGKNFHFLLPVVCSKE